MSQPQTCTVTISYEGLYCDISFPENTAYEDFIKLAMEVFKIPTKVVDYIKTTAGGGYILIKEAFENFLMFNPQPDMILKMFVHDSLEDTSVELGWKQLCIGPKEAREPQLKKKKFDYYSK